MSYQQFMKELVDHSEACLDAVDERHHFFLEDSSFLKEAAELDESERRSQLAQRKYGLSDAEYKMATKIAQEIEQITHTLRFQSCKDSDYLTLMKEAGVPISGDVQPEITEVLERTLTKVASGEDLNPLEELYTMSDSFQKVAGIGSYLKGLGAAIAGKPIEKVVTKTHKPWFGRLGSYAMLGAPIAAGGAYLSGRASGAQAKEQEIANELAEKLRYAAQKRQAETQAEF